MSVVLLVAAAACVAAGVRGSAWSRRYVEGVLLQDPRTVERSRWLLSARTQGVLVAAVSVPVAWWAWRAGHPGEGVAAVVTTATAMCACSVDLVCHRLPNRILGVGALVLGGVLGGLVALGQDPGALVRALAGGAVTGGVTLVLALVPSGLGMGDVKLAGLLGGWLGWLAVSAAVTGLVLGFLVGGVAAVAMLLGHRAGPRTLIAYGPYLAAGAVLAWFAALA